MKSNFEILGLKNNASRRDIQKAYRQLVKKHHPDVGGNLNAWHEMRAAYKALLTGDVAPPEVLDPFTSLRLSWWDYLTLAAEDFWFRGRRLSCAFDPAMDRRGLDLYIDVDTPQNEALSGGKRMIETPLGRYQVKIPPLKGKQPLLRLKGKGLKYPWRRKKGDLYVRFFIVL